MTPHLLISIAFIAPFLCPLVQAGAIGECLPVGEHAFHCVGIKDDLIPCKDEHEKCQEWRSRGECKANPGYMLYHCRESCESCVECVMLNVIVYFVHEM